MRRASHTGVPVEMPNRFASTEAAMATVVSDPTGATITGCDVVGAIPATDVSCDTSGATAAFSDASAGTWTVTVIGLALAGTDAANYTAGDTDTTSATITPRAVAVAISDGTKVYGASDPVLGYSITDGSLVAGDDFSGTPVRVAGEHVGTYEITQGTLELGPNYALDITPGSFEITPATLSVTADSTSRTYGTTNPVFTYQVTGFQLGETEGTAAAYGAPVCSIDATTGSPVGVRGSRQPASR